MVNSPEFKARIARAEEAGRRAQAYVNSPEFKARIERATARAAEAQARINSPEFKAHMERMQSDIDAAMKHLDDLPAPPSPPTINATP